MTAKPTVGDTQAKTHTRDHDSTDTVTDRPTDMQLSKRSDRDIVKQT